VVTKYSYDLLDRVFAKSYDYAPPGTQSNCYVYDTAANGKGRLGFEWTQTASCPSTPPMIPPTSGYQSLRVFGAYDAMGRVTTERRCLGGYCTSASLPAQPTANCSSLLSPIGMQYCYDLAGNLLAYGNGVTTSTAGSYPQQALLFSQSFDTAGRLATVGSSWSDTTHPAALFTAEGYTAANTLSSWLLGAHLLPSRSYDNRLRVTGQTTVQR
jgi:hypothetical protein